ncbi:hypothetical protein F5Y16DRAFT_64946 [Xylariaceae sp. FL0255]|nr:hypothetical protein F5Y16DRAFT_64946 [Xylariaceae sp. FL0255]
MLGFHSNKPKIVCIIILQLKICLCQNMSILSATITGLMLLFLIREKNEFSTHPSHTVISFSVQAVWFTIAEVRKLGQEGAVRQVGYI